MKLFHRKIPTGTFGERLKKRVILSSKILLFLVKPVVVAVAFTAIWYSEMYKRDLNFGGEELTTGILMGIASLFFVVYAVILGTPALQSPCEDYKIMCIAAKQEQWDTFMDYADEDLSPLWHMVMIIIALFSIAPLLLIKYPIAGLGEAVIFAFVFVFAFIFFVIREVDDPRTGLWAIESLPEYYRNKDPKEWRKERTARLAHEALQGKTEGASLPVHAEPAAAVA